MAMLPSIPEIAKQVEVNKGDILLKANISDIPNLIGEISKSQNGWCKLANGLIVQWGRFTFHNPAIPIEIFFPVSFTGGYSFSSHFDGIQEKDRPINISLYAMNMYVNYAKLISNCAGGTQVSWLAIGY